MGIIDVILAGLALSIDACALTVANCNAYKDSLNKKLSWAMPVTFALFQGLMPLIGYYIGSLFCEYLQSVGSFITAGVFFILAVKLLIDILRQKEDGNVTSKITLPLILTQGVATSIDAFIVGITLSIELTFSIFWAVLIIAAVTFALVTLALFFGKGLGKLFGKYANWVGLILLLIIAIKSLVEGLI